MKLYYAAASPFVRKVHMAAIELSLDADIELIDTQVTPLKENTDYADRINPLRKIPALEIDKGSIIHDSSVICEYLNDLEGSNRLIPARGPDRWQVQTGHSVANGIMDAAVVIRYETFMRPEEHRWSLWVDEQWKKIDNALGWFDSRKIESLDTIDEIALASALGYLDFRFKEFPWRNRYSNLSRWHSLVSTKMSYKKTSPE